MFRVPCLGFVCFVFFVFLGSPEGERKIRFFTTPIDTKKNETLLLYRE